MPSATRPAILRALVLVVILGAWLALGAFGGQAQGKLSQVQTNDNAAFLPTSAESTKAAELNAKFVSDETLPALIVVRPASGGEVSAEQLAAVRGFAAGLGKLTLAPDEAATTEGGPQTMADLLASDPVVAPAGDGMAALVIVPLDAAAAGEQLGERSVGIRAVEVLRTALADDLGATATDAGELGLKAWVTGPAGFVADLVTAFGGIDGVLLLVALITVLVILVVVYRSPFLPFVVIGTAVFALSAAGLVVYHLAAAGRLTLNGQAQGILSILVVGASVDYALLLVARYREELGHVQMPWQAMRRAWTASVEPITASAATVIAGLLVLMLSDLASNASLGPVAAIGILAAWLAALTLLPAVLLAPGRFARGLFWPRRPRPSGEESGPRATAELLTGIWGHPARLIQRNARAVWAITAALLFALAAFLPTFQAGGSDEADIFRTEVDAVSGAEVLAEHFPAGAVQPAQVFVPADQLEPALQAVQSVPGVASAAPYAAGRPGAASGEPVQVGGWVRIDAVTEAAADTQEAVRTVSDIRTAVHEVAPTALVGGAAAETLDVQAAGARDLRLIVPVVLIVIWLILMMLLRSVAAALLLIAANVLSFAATMGLAAIVFNHVLDLPAADPTVPLYGFTFLVALGVDYSIFLMTRVREESRVHGTRIGVLRALAVTGGVITSAGVVLAATFAALAVLPLLFMVQLAFIVAVGVLIDTLVVRSLLVPALVHDLGPRTWWPSRLSRAESATPDASPENSPAGARG